MYVLLSPVWQRRLSSHAAECGWHGYTSGFSESRWKSERARPGRTWREPGGSANPSISDSVRLKLGEVATGSTYISKMFLKKTSMFMLVLRVLLNMKMCYVMDSRPGYEGKFGLSHCKCWIYIDKLVACSETPDLFVVFITGCIVGSL